LVAARDRSPYCLSKFSSSCCNLTRRACSSACFLWICDAELRPVGFACTPLPGGPPTGVASEISRIDCASEADASPSPPVAAAEAEVAACVHGERAVVARAEGDGRHRVRGGDMLAWFGGWPRVAGRAARLAAPGGGAPSCAVPACVSNSLAVPARPGSGSIRFRLDDCTVLARRCDPGGVGRAPPLAEPDVSRWSGERGVFSPGEAPG
jgi:hypothetical protein